MGKEAYSVWLNRLDGSYRYTDFSTMNEETRTADERTLINMLSEFDIVIPNDAQFHQVDDGTYEWRVEQLQMDGQLIDGSLIVNYVGTLGNIEQNLITYDKVKDITIKSEQEAYEELLKGKFIYEFRDIDSLYVHEIGMRYMLDSKGFYQPVYVFTSEVDGERVELLIQAQ